MPYRPVDLQVSVPKTQETGMQQSQLQSRLAAEARQQAEQAAKKTEQDRSRSTELESRADAKIGYRQEESGSGGAKAGDRRGKAESGELPEERTAHPYKGRRIDIRL
ncbi:hypothetical protein ACTHPH_03140 [Paenibacillus pasadenensis]|uniref:Uncharacterized protein n=1 Tax=Paenibacillus pasadenensis TaxID=217090 RepID=A0A2N5N756_9BACL|nr:MULTISPECIES: hypothetical protein [Paenibacillus]PLT46172.1 hypothetical protein B8V81_4603 [Paenibacillus pasadenensis]QGG56634.1 hypothetical protein GE073_14275 [Paenibacillus sp. B01]